MYQTEKNAPDTTDNIKLTSKISTAVVLEENVETEAYHHQTTYTTTFFPSGDPFSLHILISLCSAFQNRPKG